MNSSPATLADTTGDVRQGSLSVCNPRITPPIGVELTVEQRLACASRILARERFAENLAGHIT